MNVSGDHACVLVSAVFVLLMTSAVVVLAAVACSAAVTLLILKVTSGLMRLRVSTAKDLRSSQECFR